MRATTADRVSAPGRRRNGPSAAMVMKMIVAAEKAGARVAEVVFEADGFRLVLAGQTVSCAERELAAWEARRA